jgi:hypothetical protein
MFLFKKDIKYSLDGKTIEKHIFKSGEEHSLDSVLNALGKNNLDFFLQKSFIEVKKQEVPVLESTGIDLEPIDTTQIDVVSQDTSTVDTSAQDNDNAQNQTQSIDTQPVQDSDATINTIQPQDGNEADTQDNTQPQAFEIVYKITQPIQDKDGNEIEVGSQFTESELKELIVVDQRKSNKKIKELLQDEKLIEIKKLSQ